MKKTLFFVVIILFASVGSLQAQAEWLPNSPSDVYFCVSHPAPGIVYMAGYQSIYKSYDDGDSWETVFTFDSIFPARFYGMWFWDEQTGYATGARNPKNVFWLWDYIPFTSRLYKTQDGGMSWQCLDTSHYFFNIRFVNQDTLFALEQTEHALYKSVDGGHTWDCVLSGPNLIDYSVVDSLSITEEPEFEND